MTRVKSLRYGPEEQGHGHVHRTHRSKKGRKHKGKQHDLYLDWKRKKEDLKLKDLDT